MSFEDVRAADAVNVFANPDEFGEELTYTPHGGSPTTVRAVVTRHPERADPSRRYKADEMEISIPNDADDGVTAVTRGQDLVAVAPIIGGAVQTCRVIDILYHDSAMWRLKVRGGT